MPGRHVSADRSRFRRDLIRLIVLFVLAAVVTVGVVVSLRRLIGGSEQPDPGPAASSMPADISSRPTSTEVSTTTTAPPPTTVASSTTTTTLPVTATSPPVREPGETNVLVLNSTRISGLAGRVTDRLAAVGYRTEQPGNHPSPLDTSVIWYVEGFDREAQTLAEEIPDATIQPFPDDEPRAHLTVVLGASDRE